MKWKPGQTSQDIEDRRGMGGGGGRFGGGRGLGIGGFVILLILSVVFKQDFFSLLGGGAGLGSTTAPSAEAGPVASTPEEELRVKFVGFVLDSAQNFWQRKLPALGAEYQRARLVLFRGSVESACGSASAATGPFYCPGDQKVYIDLSFLDELDQRFGAPGDFAQAYVLAHEIGHHVQTLLGIEGKARGGSNQAQVALELQADCLAGIWGHETAAMGILEEGDVNEGLAAASAVGDDRIQKQAQGYVNPETFTHGSSEQRARWFMRGFKSGRIEDCDTFNAR